MAGQPVPDTDGEYDDDAYNNLPASRQDFGDNQTGVTIANGIRTNQNGTELYLRVRETGADEPSYYENELNKTYYDNK